MKQKVFMSIFGWFLLFFSFAIPAGAADISVTVDNIPVAFTDAQPYVNSLGRTMVPLRAVAEALDCEVTYNEHDISEFSVDIIGTKDLVTVSKTEYFPLEGGDYGEISGMLVFLPSHPYWPDKIITDYFAHNTYWESGEHILFENPQELQMDTYAIIKNGRTYLPIRYVAEYFDYSVSWNSQTSTVEIQSGAGRWHTLNARAYPQYTTPKPPLYRYPVNP